MLLLAGSYRIAGAQPDGDSIRFYPQDPGQWDLVAGPNRVRRNARGGAQLRLDGIDALETHYTVPMLGVLRQPRRFGDAAAARLLELAGFTDVQRNADETVTGATPEQAPGYVLTRGADLNGRCVAVAGAGAPPGENASQLRVGVELLRESLNHRLVAEGLAYPTYYRMLYADLRAELTRVVEAARPGDGLWPSDASQSGVEVEGLATLTDEAVILPKLFRRLTDYLALGDGDPSLAGFRAYLAQREDRLTVLSTGRWTGFDTVVEVSGQRVRLLRPPEDLVFDER